MAKTKSDILASGGPAADKFRDHLGETIQITDYLEVNTKNGPAVQLLAEVDGEQLSIWAPSVVANQIRELAEHDYLPGLYRFAEVESANGHNYFTLEDPTAEDDGPEWGAA